MKDSSTDPPKKKLPKTEKSDAFEVVKNYLSECPHLPPDHPAIKAALEGVDKEQKRRDRDARLQTKFAQSTASSTSLRSSSAKADATALEDSVVVVGVHDKPSASSNTKSSPSNSSSVQAGEDEMMEWQDLQQDGDDSQRMDEETSYIGKKLTKLAIESLAQSQVKVSTPMAALAVVLHAALRSDFLGFKCTGIPDDNSRSKGGFAAPVRELPKTQFLPTNWDSNSSKNSLRYRKEGTGALVLQLLETDGSVTVQLQPTISSEPPDQLLRFPLGDHVNLDSWNAATQSNPRVAPALHYKSLARLLTKFCRTFDLGSVDEVVDGEPASALFAVAASPGINDDNIRKSDFIPTQQPILGVAVYPRGHGWKGGVPSNLDEAFPGIHHNYDMGDFAGDLAPAGLQDPRFARAGCNGGRIGGSLMGPNHPMFHGGGVGGGLPAGPGSMQPRFDPFYPPGVDPNGGGDPKQRPTKQHTPGEPNPDHLPPPNSFGNDMFS